MEVEGIRLYRVRAVAELLDVSVATVYRAIESGALRVGVGKGAVRVPRSAVADYVQTCELAAAGGRGVMRVPDRALGGEGESAVF